MNFKVFLENVLVYVIVMLHSIIFCISIRSRRKGVFHLIKITEPSETENKKHFYWITREARLHPTSSFLPSRFSK